MSNTYTPTPANRVLSNRRQQAKLSWKRKQMMELTETIAADVESYGIVLPTKAADYEQHKWAQLANAGYDITDASFRDGWEQRNDELVKLFYSIKRTNKAVYALFEHGGTVQPMLLTAWYNKHRFDMVWLWRKSQLIRNIYREYLTNNEQLLKNTHPIHMVLTVPHANGLFKGKRFYARELLAHFHELRRSPFWKRHVYGGEYGLEIKKSKTNGLHIHVHSLCFLHKTITVNNFRLWLKERWESLTGGCMVHAETLYYYERKDNGHYITEPMRKKNKHGEWEEISTVKIVPGESYWDDEAAEWVTTDETYEAVPVERRKKHYVNDNSTLDEYLKGILECIKYHFKHDACEDEKGAWDLELMRDILNNSKRLRFYSRYGAFYKEKELCFDKLDDTEDIEGAEIEMNGSAARSERELVNPYTEMLANEGEYKLCISSPERLKYSGKNDLKPYSLLTHGTSEFIEVQEGFTIKDIIQSMCRGEISRVLKHGYKHKTVFA